MTIAGLVGSPHFEALRLWLSEAKIWLALVVCSRLSMKNANGHSKSITLISVKLQGRK